MKTFSSINENNDNPDLGGKNSFEIFIDIINELDLLFIKHDFYNIGEYSYFFSTEKIQNNINLLHTLERKSSLKHAYLTLATIKEQRLSFYFGIKRKKLFYGFYDEDTKYVYKVGVFNTTSSYLKKMKSMCFSSIKSVLIDADMMKMNKLHQIKSDFDELFPGLDAEIKIKENFRISKKYSTEQFNQDDIVEDRLDYTILSWSRKYKWYKDVYSFVNITEKYIYFYIKLKTKE
jgi:hypothetical protein